MKQCQNAVLHVHWTIENHNLCLFHGIMVFTVYIEKYDGPHQGDRAEADPRLLGDRAEGD